MSIVLNAQSQREKMLLNNDWRFAKGHASDPSKDFNYGQALSFSKIAFLQQNTMLENDQESRLAIPHVQRFDDSKWEKISLPHDWGMRLGYGKEQFSVKGYRTLGGRSPENSVGWYRKTFKITAEKGCRYNLEFEGIFRDAQVWMNGIHLGNGWSGYVPLNFDVTECINYGPDAENVITVRVDATHSELWSYEGAGIYRNVWLVQTADVYIPQYGTYVTSDVADEGGEAKINALIEIRNESTENKNVTLRQTITDDKGNQVAKSEDKATAKSLETSSINSQLVVNQANMWSPETPNLYYLNTDIIIDGKVVDNYVTRFGIRTIRFDANEGFFLNGKRVQIQGVCCHQDHAGVGIAVPDRLNFWRIERLKEYGVNAYRASHNPPTVSVLEACDSIGMLVMDEMRVLSSSNEGLSQMETVIRRDRNHPSIIIWCLGNEEPALQGNDKGQMIVERMKNVQRKLDPTRPCTAAMNGDWGKGFSYAVDVQGSNYFMIGSLDDVHSKFPELPCLLSEEASTVTTRGIYKTEPSKGYHQAYDRDRPGWGATAQEWMRYVDKRKFIAGAFIWTGFDYGGESTINYWPGVSSHFGVLDYCGFPKDAFWYYKAWWTTEPVVHILPHWNGINSDSVDVHVYTNLDDVELIVNGKKMGKVNVDKYDIPAWRVKYVPGKIEAVGKKDGKTYSQVVETTNASNALVLSSETGTEINGDGQDAAVITVKVIDNKQRLVPTASDEITFEIENGVILGVGNGNPSSQEADVFPVGAKVFRNAFGGYAQAIITSDRSGKPIVLTVKSAGLKEDKIIINTK